MKFFFLVIDNQTIFRDKIVRFQYFGSLLFFMKYVLQSGNGIYPIFEDLFFSVAIRFVQLKNLKEIFHTFVVWFPESQFFVLLFFSARKFFLDV